MFTSLVIHKLTLLWSRCSLCFLKCRISLHLSFCQVYNRTTMEETVKTFPALTSSAKETKSRLFYGILLELCLKRGINCHVANNYLYSFTKENNNYEHLTLVTKRSMYDSIKHNDLKNGEFHPVVNDKELMMKLSIIATMTSYKDRVFYVDCCKLVDSFQYFEHGSTGTTLSELYKVSQVGQLLSNIESPLLDVSVCRIYYGDLYFEYTIDTCPEYFRNGMIKLLDRKINNSTICSQCLSVPLDFKCCPACDTTLCDQCFKTNALKICHNGGVSEMKCYNPCCNYMIPFRTCVSRQYSNDIHCSTRSVTKPGCDMI